MSNEKFQNKYRIPSARATWHDYNGGEYFITICTKNRQHYFGEINHNGEMDNTEIGNHTVNSIQNIPNHFPDAEIPVFVVMPNHVHLIVKINEKFKNTPRTDAIHGVSVNDTNCTDANCKDAIYGVSTDDAMYGVSTDDAIYGVSTKTANNSEPPSKNEKMQSIANQCGRLSHIISNFKSSVTRYANKNNITFAWQERFHDHIIRNQNDKNRITIYIENNPIKWNEDKFYSK